MTLGEASIHTARMEAQAVEIPGPRDPAPDAQDAPSVRGVTQNGAPVGRGNTLSECNRPCPRCGRPLLGAADLAARADAVRAIIEGCVALGLTRPGGALADAYGGDVRDPLQGALQRAADLAIALSRAAACLAQTCIIPPANDGMR
jgi:hypothetical protein